MAEIQPLRALHYDQAVVGPLADVVAPPYDVIDDSQRAQLLARSPDNVVAVDLPKGEGDTYAEAGERFEGWQREGVLVRDAEPALWAHTQDYTGPDGVARTRRGFFCRVRIEPYGPGPRAPARAHPPRSQGGPPAAHACHPGEHLPDLLALLRPRPGRLGGARARHRAGAVGRGHRRRRHRHRIWRVSDPAAIAAVQRATAHAELLIADGHHRYETMQAYAEELDDAAKARSTPGRASTATSSCAWSRSRTPGLTIFPTHRLVERPRRARRAALAGGARARLPDRGGPPRADRPRRPASGPLQLGYYRPPRRTPAAADAEATRRSPTPRCRGARSAYRELDTGVLEALVLKGALGLSDDDISHFNGMFYARDTEEALAMVDSGAYDAAFLMRPTRVEQVRELAAAGENMPPKSTFFFPKLLTGLLFNPLA